MRILLALAALLCAPEPAPTVLLVDHTGAGRWFDVGARPRFLGSRALGADGGYERLFGDDELLLLPLEGAPRWVELPADAVLMEPVCCK